MNKKALESLMCEDSQDYLDFVRSIPEEYKDTVITFVENLSDWYDFVDKIKCFDYEYVIENMKEAPELEQLYGFNSETKYLLFFDDTRKAPDLYERLSKANITYAYIEKPAYNQYINKLVNDEHDRLLDELETKKKAREDELYDILSHGFFG